MAAGDDGAAAGVDDVGAAADGGCVPDCTGGAAAGAGLIVGANAVAGDVLVAGVLAAGVVKGTGGETVAGGTTGTVFVAVVGVAIAIVLVGLTAGANTDDITSKSRLPVSYSGALINITR
jgi:hypothetical protein